MTVPEAGRLLGISRNLSYRAARLGDIPTIKVGRRKVVPIEAFEAMLRDAKQVRE
jgi:excisionase family DNA binding protein